MNYVNIANYVFAPNGSYFRKKNKTRPIKYYSQIHFFLFTNKLLIRFLHKKKTVLSPSV